MDDSNNNSNRRNSGGFPPLPSPSRRVKTGTTPPQSPQTSPRGSSSSSDDDLMARFLRLRDDLPQSTRQSSSEVGLGFLDLPSVPKHPIGTRNQSATFKELEGGKSSGGATDTITPTSPREFSAIQTSKPKPKFEQDYQRIHTLLQNKDEVMGHFQSLESSLESGVRLKDALYQTEQQHGFAPQIHRVSGLQSNEDFMGMVNERVLFKDRGAARDHGENTHRLQWYAVAKDMETNPQHYTTTKASDLYKGLAERYQQGQRSKYHWMSLFDHDFESKDFRQAEVLHSHLKTQQTLPRLGAATLAEDTKRGKLGPDLDRLRKGPERNAKIQEMERNPIQSGHAQKVQEYKTGENHQPRVRLEGEQPKSTPMSFQPITRGGKT